MRWYRFIHAERARYPIAVLCRVLRIARSAYYAWARCGVSARAQADEELTVCIAAAYARSRRTYGAPGCTPSCGPRACAAPASGWLA